MSSEDFCNIILKADERKIDLCWNDGKRRIWREGNAHNLKHTSPSLLHVHFVKVHEYGAGVAQLPHLISRLAAVCSISSVTSFSSPSSQKYA